MVLPYRHHPTFPFNGRRKVTLIVPIGFYPSFETQSSIKKERVKKNQYGKLMLAHHFREKCT